ncbi:MAG: hypothetical protein QHH10_00330 [Peptococcaceae bacterium]|jgi:hypothetical protein|nr:hypothetical protein [Peptococcaceae bacterium]MDH7523751.1 hypothetical protein [Peptococcaceae bacterium]
MSPLPQPFPKIDVSEDYNPAIRLYGHRFIKEQTILEYAAEFLSVVFSPKWIGKNLVNSPLPTREELDNWPVNLPLKYKPPIKLNLKLFAFLGASRIDGRHEVHKQHFKELIDLLNNSIRSNQERTQEVIECLQEFLRGFQGAGLNRAWCAQAFYPISASLLTKETIWNESKAKNCAPDDWFSTISTNDRFIFYYSTNKRDFMARGGELLYLQLCNVFRTDEAKLHDMASQYEFPPTEADIQQLYQDLCQGLSRLNGVLPSPFDKLVDFIENLDIETHRMTNKTNKNEKKQMIECEWCPEDSWPEGYLFAVELKRLMDSTLDPTERLNLFMTGCVLQVLRSICAQSVRYAGISNKCKCPLGYSWIFTVANPTTQQRNLSQHNLQAIQVLIQKSLWNEDLQENAKRSANKTKSELYKEAESRYAFKLLISLGKKLGIIIPYKGTRGVRFVMTQGLLRYLVVALLQPGERITYKDFLDRLYLHYGIAVEGEQLEDALQWSGLPPLNVTQKMVLNDMLQTGGFLTQLSDYWSIVRNPFISSNKHLGDNRI